MALEEVVPSLSLNMSNVLGILPQEVSQAVNWGILALKAIGIFLAFYILLEIINMFLNIGRNKKLKRIEAKLDDLDKKITAISDKFNKKKDKK